jgi:hypothetical protein
VTLVNLKKILNFFFQIFDCNLISAVIPGAGSVSASRAMQETTATGQTF